MSTQMELPLIRLSMANDAHIKSSRLRSNVPKRLRSKLARRWRLGTYLGVVNTSNEHYIGLKNGNIIESRSVARVVEASRWSAEAVLGVIGTPSLLCPSGPEDMDPSIESLERPHEERDA